MSPPRRIPGLDGLRALSIVMVMASHLAGSAILGGGQIPLGTAHAWGKVGVRVFFVISGFLITKLLIEEVRRLEGVSIRAFYVRRVFRILPAFVVYLVVLLGLRALGWVAVPADDLWHAATYTTNFDVDRAWLVSHIWSLSVEEHYYLVWPLVFAVASRRAPFWVALLTCIVSPVARYCVFAFLPEHLDALVWQATPCVADSIATGCILAYVRDPDARESIGPLARLLDRLLAYTRRSAATYALLLPAFFTYLLETRPTVWTLVAVSFSNVAFATVIDRVVTDQSDLVGRLLMSRVAERVGVLSYSLYLWQQLFLRQSAVEAPSPWAHLCAFPLNLVAAFACAHVCFELIERRALRMRPRSADR
jgi:peptidoglycan/LPS O-acetylase OafA/YrhL